MRRRRLPALMVLLAVAAVAAPGGASAASAAWPVRTVATGGPAFHRDVDGLPGGRVATLLERQVGRVRRLELWIGATHRLIATSAKGHTFDAQLGHDAAGRVVVAWATVPDAGGSRQAFAWTAGAGVQRLTSAAHSVTTVDLAVAPDGRAVIGAPVGGTQVVVVRGSTAGFGSPETLVAGAGFPEEVGIADDGTVTVAWDTRTAVGLMRAAPDQAFGAPVTVPIAHLDEMAFTVTGAGRAVVAAKQTERKLSGSYARSVSVLTWEPGAAAPGAPVVVSQGQAGVPAATAVGDRAFVVWRQARTTTSGPAALGVATFAAPTPHVRITIPGRGGAGGPLGSIQLAPSGSGVRPYFGVGGSIHTTHVDASGRVSGTGVAIGPAEGRPFPSVADAGGPVAVWTRRLFDDNAGYRIRIARP